ncbi:P-loop containing nucleoside triphosphate hydrolase protein [Dendryphion nanum]|uniref:P-loop containing nucleoside triphosphate hydrolase protein n=1 Tax=Dendryphion nanum TaxID=256645 RepID=A0A9P9DUU3_9PLEO|nr:P-loop containing nucleoside triphosphate hydrolase protein [Dendryphion nanum]
MATSNDPPASCEHHEKKRDEVEEKTPLPKQAGLKSLFAFTTKEHIPILCCAFFFGTIVGLVFPALAIIYGLIFQQFAKFGSGQTNGAELLSSVSKYCLYLTAVTTGGWLASSLWFMAQVTFGELQAKGARNSVFNALLNKNIEWYDTRENGTAAVLSAVQLQIRDLQLSTSQPLGQGYQNFVLCVGSLGVAFYYSWNLTLVIICTVPLIFLVMSFLGGRLAKRAHEQADKLQLTIKYVTNAILHIELVKCFNGERSEIQKFAVAIARAADLYRRQAHIRSLQVGFMTFVTMSVFVQGFWYGSYLIISGKKSPGDVMTTFWGALLSIQGITGFLPQLIVIQKGKVAGARLQTIIAKTRAKKRETEKLGGKRSPGDCKGKVEFTNVSFAYPSRPNHLALRDVSLSFPAGKTVFVVGRSGSGKSTVGQLLVRFYEASAGQISIDDVIMGDLNTKWLRENVTLVEQHSVLFNETIRQNIALAKGGQEVNDDLIKGAINFAVLENMIKDLPQGLNTKAGAKGNSLSGGQKQRVAISRAWLRDTPVLILDESTSALDYITRSTILSSIRKWRHDKTTIVITHDISQIESEDYIYVLDEAQVVQKGYRAVLEAAPDSAFQTFVAAEDEKKYLDEVVSDDYDYSIYDLYDRPRWEGRPTSVADALFSDTLLSPFLNPNRSSMIMSTPIRPSATISDALRKMSVTHDPPRSNNLSKPLPFATGDPNNLGETRSHGLSALRPLSSISTHPISLSQDVPIRLDMGDSTSNNSKSRLKRWNRRSASSSGTLSVIQILKTFWPRLDWQTRATVTFALICATVHGGCTPAFGFLFGRLLSTLYATTNQRTLSMRYSLAILGVSIIDGLMTYAFYFLFDVCAQKWVNSVKEDAMKRVLAQPREFFDQENNSVARIAECFDHFGEEARNLPGRFLPIIIVMIVTITVAFIWSMSICWKLTLVSISTGPILYGILSVFNATSGYWETLSNLAGENVSEVLYETFINIRTVRCLVIEEVFRNKYMAVATTALNAGTKRAIYTGSVYGLNYSGAYFVAALCFWYGAYIIASGEFPTTSIVQTFTIILLSVSQVNHIGNYIPQINISKDAGSRLLRLANLKSNSHELQGTTPMASAGDINFHNLSFSYPTRKDHLVLKRINLFIPRGSCTAIVGSSGSGKSTIAALLLKLYQTEASAALPGLTISSTNIRDLHTQSLRSRITIVSQNPILFPGTIAENISYGFPLSSPRASLDSVRAAATAAGIDEFITSLPDAYQTLVGEGGTGVSGGQAQRIAIARALVRDPDILILDEATSALDVESAGTIRDTIQRLVMEVKTGERVWEGGTRKKGRFDRRSAGRKLTVVIITHAREMMAIAEKVVMMDQGIVVEEGTFEELRRRRGAFARLLRGEGLEE